MALWNIQSKELSRLMLWRTSDHEFRVMEQGKFVDILTNADYILFSKKYERILLMLDDQIILNSVIIVDKVKGLTIEDYLELEIRNEVEPDTVDSLPSEGLKIYAFGESVFVSDEVKKEFEEMGDNELEFSLGFSLFAG